MNDLEHARELLVQAKADLDAMRGMIVNANDEHGMSYFTDSVFGFHAQQAAEKILKAWIASLGKSYNKKHDLMLFVNQLEDSGENVTELSELVDLNLFAVDYRYEAIAEEDEKLNREYWLGKIEKLYDQVLQKIKSP
jgi:HEPN domain-containing protein